MNWKGVENIKKYIVAEILIVLACFVFVGTTFFINIYAGFYLLGVFLLLYGISIVKGGGD